MSRSIDLESLKRKLYLSYHGDGILDLAIGLTILGFGISMQMDSGASIILSWLGLMLYAPLKSIITIPRMGYVQFEEASKRRSHLLAMLGIGVGTLVLFVTFILFMRADTVSVEFDTWFNKYYLLVLGGIPALALIVTALRTGVSRFFLHALLILGIIFAGIQLNIAEPTYVMILGGIILLIGLGLLVRFLRKYPNVDKGDEDGLV